MPEKKFEVPAKKCKKHERKNERKKEKKKERKIKVVKVTGKMRLDNLTE